MVLGYATFSADVPDDIVWNKTGDVKVPGGRAIMTWLSTALVDRGLRCTPLAQHSWYGWEFTAEHANGRVWCMIQFPGPWLLITEPRWSLSSFFFSRGPTYAHQSVVDEIDAALRSDHRFSDVSWATRQDYEQRA
jgi:hypothetical protein